MSSFNTITAGKAAISLVVEDLTGPGMTKAEKGLRDYGKAWADVGASAGVYLTASLAPAAASVRAYTAFADQMAVVRAVTGASKDQFSALNGRAEELGRTTSFTATQVAEAMTELAKAGFTTDQIMTAIGGTLNTARAGGLQLADATTITTDALRSFNLTADQASRVGDILSKTANVSSTDVRQIGEALKYVSSVANMSGQKIEGVSGALAVLANRGLKADMAGTSLAQIFLQLTNSDVQKTLAKMGVAVMDAEGNMRDLTSIMGELGEKTAGMGNAQKLGLFQQLFDVRGMRAAAMLTQNTREWTDAIRMLEQAQGSAAKAAANMDDTIGGSWRSMTSAIEGTQIAFGKATEGPLRTAYAGVSALARVASSFIENNQGLVATLAMSTAGLAVFSGGLYATGKAMSALSYSVSGYRAIAEWTKTLAERYRAFLTQMATGQTAQQAQAAATQKSATAEEQLAAAATNAAAAMKGQTAALAQVVALLDKISISAAQAASALKAQSSAQTASAAGWTNVHVSISTVLTSVTELKTAIAQESAAIKENTGSTARNVQSIKALTGWQRRLSTATANATAALKSQTAATAQVAEAEDTAAKSGAVLATTNQEVAVTATQAAAATAKIAPAASGVAAVAKEAQAAGLAAQTASAVAGSAARTNVRLFSDAELAAMRTGDAINKTTLVAERFGRTNVRLFSTAQLAAMGYFDTMSRGQKVLAGLKTFMASGGAELAAMGIAYGAYKAGQSAYESKLGEKSSLPDGKFSQQAAEYANLTKTAVDRLQELANNAQRTSQEQAELRGILEDINSRYGVIKGSIDDVIASQERPNEVGQKARKAARENEVGVLTRELAEAKAALSVARNRKDNLTGLVERNSSVINANVPRDLADFMQGEKTTLSDLIVNPLADMAARLGMFTGSISGDMDEASKSILDAQDRVQELEDKLKKLSGAQKAAAQSAQTKTPGDLYTGLDASGVEAAQKRLADLEDQYRRSRQTSLENEIEDLKKNGDEVAKLLQDLQAAAVHRGDTGAAKNYEQQQRQNAERTAKLTAEAQEKAQQDLASSRGNDQQKIDDLMAQDAEARQLARQNQLIDRATEADPAQAARMLQAYQAQLDASVTSLRQQAQQAIDDAYADGVKTPEEDKKISSLGDALSSALSRRSDVSGRLQQAQAAAAEKLQNPTTWETRGAFGGAAGALGTGLSSNDEKQTKSLEEIQRDMDELLGSFKEGIKIKVS